MEKEVRVFKEKLGICLTTVSRSFLLENSIAVIHIIHLAPPTSVTIYLCLKNSNRG